MFSRGREKADFLFVFQSLVGGSVAYIPSSQLKLKRLFEALDNVSHFVPPSRMHSLMPAMANIS